MSANKNIIWLASYPKSGNTWVRIFLANYLNPQDKAININDINISTISSSRKIFDEHVPFLSSNLTDDEIDTLRPKVYQSLSQELDEPLFIKTHDAFTQNIEGKDIFPLSVTQGIIHIVRNPLDVAVSFAHHSNISIKKSVQLLNAHNKTLSVRPHSISTQLRQKLLSWSEHYLSWKDVKAPYLLIKYEDLLNKPEATFRKIIIFIYQEVNDEKLRRAIQFSSFKELKKQEKDYSFNEKALKSKQFFRKGVAGSWQTEMTKEEITTIIDNHRKIMLELNYLTN